MRPFDAPHRVFFLGGLAQVMLALVLWSLWLAGAFAGAYTPPALPVSAIALHGFLMVYGVFPFFVFGFLATTYPRWMQAKALARAEYRNPAILRIAGLVVIYLGLMLGLSEMVAGILMVALGDGWLAVILLQIYRKAKASARRGIAVFPVTIFAEVAGLLLYALGLYSSSPVVIALAIRVGLFLFLLPTLFGVSFRMVPFFSAAVLPHYQRPVLPPWVPLGFLLGTALHALFATLAWPIALVFIDGVLACVAWYHLQLWFRRDAFAHGLLLLLYAGLVWLGLGFALYAIHDASLALGAVTLGRGPLHALGLGFAFSMVIAMVTRVSRGHSGRTLQSDGVSWLALVGVQLAAILRISATFPVIDRLAGLDLSVIAAPVAVLALLPWVLRYSYILLTPRIDGQSG